MTWWHLLGVLPATLPPICEPPHARGPLFSVCDIHVCSFYYCLHPFSPMPAYQRHFMLFILILAFCSSQQQPIYSVCFAHSAQVFYTLCLYDILFCSGVVLLILEHLARCVPCNISQHLSHGGRHSSMPFGGGLVWFVRCWFVYVHVPSNIDDVTCIALRDGCVLERIIAVSFRLVT